MKPLKTNRLVLRLIGILSTENTSKIAKIFYRILSIALFLSVLSASVTSAGFFMKHLSTDLDESLSSVFQVVAFFGSTYMLIVAFILKEKIERFLNTLDKIYEMHEHNESIRFLLEANEKSEWMWRFYMKFCVTGILVSTIGLAAASVFYCKANNRGFDLRYLYFLFKTTFPLDQQTPCGYWAKVCFDIVVGEAYLISNGAFMLLFISICWHHQAFYKRFKDSIYKINTCDQQSHAEAILRELIVFHNAVKSWFTESSVVYSQFILVQLIYTVFLLASVFFELDMQLDHVDMSKANRLIVLVLATMIGTSNLYLYCYFGRMATISYAQMAHCIFESNWVDLPIYLKKYLILMIGNAQRPLYYHGFGLVTLKLETFARLLRITVTYYMMFKTVTTRPD